MDPINNVIGLGRKLSELHDVAGDTAKGSLGKNCPPSHVRNPIFEPANLLFIESINELEVATPRLVVANGEAKELTKVISKFHLKDARSMVDIFNGAVRGVDNVELIVVDSLDRKRVEITKGSHNGVVIGSIGSRKHD